MFLDMHDTPPRTHGKSLRAIVSTHANFPSILYQKKKKLLFSILHTNFYKILISVNLFYTFIK